MSSELRTETSEAFNSWKGSQNLGIPIAWTTLLAYGMLAVLFCYYVLQTLDYYPLLSIPERAWEVLVYMTPSSLVIALDKRKNTSSEGKPENPEDYSRSRSFAAKSDAMRHILGLNSASMLSSFQRARSLSGMTSIFKAPPKGSLPGLGNWDNSCYQNSVIQSLAALPSLSSFLAQTIPAGSEANGPSTATALKNVIEDLNDPGNAGQRLWTPAELKTMSSWQQQDAQEYYSKVLDEVDKEASRSMKRKRTHMGLGTIEDSVPTSREPTEGNSGDTAQCRFDQLPEALSHSYLSNPLEGLLAQRVGCLKCGFVEGLSLIPFNCLTVPLGKQWEYDLESCLDEYTMLESISGVECSKCTLLHHKEQLQRLLQRTQLSSEATSKGSSMSEALNSSVSARLNNVCDALENEDFSEVTLAKKCQIPVKARIETTKSKQAVIARLPKALTIHVNRSVFSERTGVLSKNQASVRFPKLLDLTPWCLGNSYISGQNDSIAETWDTDPSSSMLFDTFTDESGVSLADNGNLFILRAVITHFGRHENGHYICYRRNPQDVSLNDDGEEGDSWWRLSDEEVSEVSEEVVLDQGGVFMLFYERFQSTQVGSIIDQKVAGSSNTVEVLTNLTGPTELEEPVSIEEQGQQDPEVLAHGVLVTEDQYSTTPSSISRPHAQPVPVAAVESILSSAVAVDEEALLQIRTSNKSIDRKGVTIDNGTAPEDIESGDRSSGLGGTEKEDRKIPPPMRTAGVRKFDRRENGMASVSSMVTAN
ncbi:hypothetical protein MMC26_003388 [Xylographa opegraphella]|nr:hypothetical protein [Xylographa opegraphella]